MINILKLKKWLALSEAADHLTFAIQEKVTEADVLRFALNGDLILSVKFLNPAFGSNCKKYSYDREYFGDEIDSLMEAHEKDLSVWCDDVCLFHKNEILYLKNLHEIDNGRIFESGDQLWQIAAHVRRLNGVWDLPMMGGERVDVENEFQRLIGGPKLTNVSKNSVFVKSPEGAFFEIQSCNGRFVELNSSPGYYDSKDFSPVFELPNDRIFVIRTNVISSFIECVNSKSSSIETIVDSSEVALKSNNEELELDPSDYPEELDIARIAFVAVTKGGKGVGTTIKKRLIDFVKNNYPKMSDEAISRIAIMANPDKSPGRKKH